MTIITEQLRTTPNPIDTMESTSSATLDEALPALELVLKLCETLEAEKINYCHWKSNAALDRSANGENDLDLLVSREDSQKFVEILFRLNFKEALADRSEQLPGIRDYYGYDEHSDRLVHVHAHFRLVLGHDLSKNYHIPLEDPYLASAHQEDLFRVPAPEFELALFIIRMVLKHSTLDTILMRHGDISDSERSELDFLTARTTLEQVAAVYDRYLPFINHHLLTECILAIRPGCSFVKRIRAGDQLQQALKSCARRPQGTDLILKFWRRVKLPIQSRLHFRMPKKRMANGGLLIAIVGGDGSGKTTAVEGLYNEFSEEFDIKKVHLGKPHWSLITVLIRGVVKVGRTLGLYPFIREGAEATLDTNSPEFPGYPWLIREVCTAHDRYQTYLAARRYASNGGLVICDRYPIPQIKIMDGPQVERVTSSMKPNAWIRRLAKIEKQYYDRVLPPDVLVTLRVDPEVSVQRKTDEDADSVRSRAGEVWNVEWKNTNAHVIDAGKTKIEVRVDLMKVIWSHL